jgi:uncharacterized damage-inducible protein DinB
LPHQIRWTERKFEFNFPAGLYLEILERLHGTPARLEERVHSLPAAIAIRRDGDHWSIQENAGHLFDLEELWSGRFEDYDNGLPTLRAADISNLRTHAANHNARPMKDILAAFRRARFAMISSLDQRGPEYFERSALHPRLKNSMRAVDLLFFVAEHDDYHLARISELIRLFQS